MDYKASMDSSVISITVGIVILLVIVACFLFWLSIRYYQAKQYGKTVPYLLISFGLIALLIYAYGINVSKYQIGDGNLIVVTPFHDRVIKKANIITVSLMNRTQLDGITRISGDGGLFGFTGFFKSKAFDRLSLYATRNSHFVLIQLKDGENVVITPDDIGLVNELR